MLHHILQTEDCHSRNLKVPISTKYIGTTSKHLLSNIKNMRIKMQIGTSLYLKMILWQLPPYLAGPCRGLGMNSLSLTLIIMAIGAGAVSRNNPLRTLLGSLTTWGAPKLILEWVLMRYEGIPTATGWYSNKYLVPNKADSQVIAPPVTSKDRPISAQCTLTVMIRMHTYAWLWQFVRFAWQLCSNTVGKPTVNALGYYINRCRKFFWA